MPNVMISSVKSQNSDMITIASKLHTMNLQWLRDRPERYVLQVMVVHFIHKNTSTDSIRKPKKLVGNEEKNVSEKERIRYETGKEFIFVNSLLSKFVFLLKVV